MGTYRLFCQQHEDNALMKLGGKQQLYDALIEAADKNYKNYYFIDLRSQTDYNTAFIEGFVNQSRENLQIFLEDASQWNMIILMSEDTEKTNEAVAYVEGLGFDNVKYVFISLERLFTFFESKNMIMEVTPNGDICPIENPEGC